MSIKAIHLEVASDLTSEEFLAALRRFTARRGVPEHIYSDNGTNFIGANNELKELYALFNSEEHKTLVNQFAIEHRIIWHIIPPVAPHFGGSSVKLFKHHFKPRVVRDSIHVQTTKHVHYRNRGCIKFTTYHLYLFGSE